MNMLPNPPSRPTLSVRAAALLAALAAGLVVAFVRAPFVVARIATGADFDDRQGLVEHLRVAFRGFWASGQGVLPSDLSHAVQFWAVYHSTKALAAGFLVVVFGILTVGLGRAFTSPTVRRFGQRVALASSGLIAAAGVFVSLLLTMANIQGAMAPFASLLPMLLESGGREYDAATLAGVRRALSEYKGSDVGRPAPLQVIIDDFAWYHVVMAAMAGCVALALAATALVVWRSARRAGPREALRRGSIVLFGAAIATISLGMVVITVANAGTAVDPVPALLAAFEGGL